MHVYELDGEALDSAVIKAIPTWPWCDAVPMPSTCYSDGMPLIEHYKLDVRPVYHTTVSSAHLQFLHWEASPGLSSEPWAALATYCNGPTILIAAMRCLVANMLNTK